MCPMPKAHAVSLLMLMFMFLPLPVLAQVQTTLQPTLPALPQAEKSPDDPDATFCRPPPLLS